MELKRRQHQSADRAGHAELAAVDDCRRPQRGDAGQG